MPLWIQNDPAIELYGVGTESELQAVIEAVYRQVLGNAHLMESERLSLAESMLRNRDITVRQFVGAVANSELYRRLFFDNNSQYRFVELNFKHLLGRAPRSKEEVAEHIRTYANHGYEAEINSYLDSEEYLNIFGEDIAPYTRASTEQLDQTRDFIRTVNLNRGRASSDLGRKAANPRSFSANIPEKAKPPATVKGANRYMITLDLPGNSSVNRKSAKIVTVDFSQLNQRIRVIQRQGGKIRSITPVAR